MNRHAVVRTLNRITKNAGLEHVYPRRFRHTLVTRHLELLQCLGEDEIADAEAPEPASTRRPLRSAATEAGILVQIHVDMVDDQTRGAGKEVVDVTSFGFYDSSARPYG